jgi:hypothetical protein
MGPRLAHSIAETRALDFDSHCLGWQGDCQAEPPVSGIEPSQAEARELV